MAKLSVPKSCTSKDFKDKVTRHFYHPSSKVYTNPDEAEEDEKSYNKCIIQKYIKNVHIFF